MGLAYKYKIVNIPDDKICRKVVLKLLAFLLLMMKYELLLTGATGVILGSCYGLVKKSPNMYVKGVTGGLNFFLITGCYVGE